jgi:hypothetical protein
MSQEERFGARDGCYSAWHRRASTRRFIGIEKAQALHMIDVDVALWVEYDDRTKEPLALVETARDNGQDVKPATVLKRLAKRCGSPPLPAYIVLYRLSGTLNPAAPEYQDIDQFRVRRIWPEPETTWTTYTPEKWALRLLELRAWSARQIDKSIPA